MTTITYELSIPLKLAVEADTWVEGRDTLAKLWRETRAVLPTGVSSTVTEEDVLSGKGIDGRWTKGIHAKVAEKIALADTYAQDGAFSSAARCLGDAYTLMYEHAKAVSA